MLSYVAVFTYSCCTKLKTNNTVINEKIVCAKYQWQLDAGRLFYVHFNDNGREWDWDMLPGSVNLWDLIEMMFYLDRMNWEGWLAYDVLTRDGNPVETMNATIAIVKTAEALLDKLGRDKLEAFVQEGIPARAFEYLVGSLL